MIGMMTAPARKNVGSANDRRAQSRERRVVEIAALENKLENLSDVELRARTEQFKQEIAAGKNPGGLPRQRPAPTRQEI